MKDHMETIEQARKSIDIYDKHEVLEFIKVHQFRSVGTSGIRISFRTNLATVSAGLRRETGNIELHCLKHRFEGTWTFRGAGLLHIKGKNTLQFNPTINKTKDFAGWLHLQADGKLEGCIYGLPVEAYSIAFGAQ